MRTIKIAISLSAALGLGLLSAMASAQSRAEQSLAEQSPLGQTLKDIDVASHWIYDDLPKALAEANSTGKPLLVVLRCVPCPPGRSLDTKVMQPDAKLEPLEKQFVCLRIVQANSLDLNQFQYDYDMSWSAMFLNADGTVYGRYGTRNATGADSDANLSASGFQAAAERALALHRQYPANREQLAAKHGKAAEYDTPREIPGLGERPARATARQNCIHCHMIREYALWAKWNAGTLSAADLWVYPMPQRIGLTMDVDDGLIVEEVEEESPAAQAGIAKGDGLIALAGQPLVSTADIQWVLQHTPNDAQLPVRLSRGDKAIEKTIALAGDWKKSDIAWRASSWYGLRQGVKCDPLPAAERAKRGIAADRMALVVKGLFGKGGPVLKQAGVQTNDVIVAADDRSDLMTETDFLAWLRLKHRPADSITLTLLRGDRQQKVTVPVW
jgi:hypothetical protein